MLHRPDIHKRVISRLFFLFPRLSIVTAFEALLVPFQATGYALFGGVHGLGALGALGDLGRGERHLESLKVLTCHNKRNHQKCFTVFRECRALFRRPVSSI